MPTPHPGCNLPADPPSLTSRLRPLPSPSVRYCPLPLSTAILSLCPLRVFFRCLVGMSTGAAVAQRPMKPDSPLFPGQLLAAAHLED